MMQLTIIGFGNQAKSWALNLKDSGFPFIVALKSNSPSLALAKQMNIPTVIIGTEDFFKAKYFALLTPDDSHLKFLEEFGLQFKPESVLLYAHGFSVQKHQLEKKFSYLKHVLFAPKSIGSELRKQFLSKGKLGAVYSLEHIQHNRNQIQEWLMGLSLALGINMGPFETTFEHETQADLYSEQGLLCSLIPYAASNMFNDLIEKGIEPELAYLECWHELKLIINAMVDVGPEGFFDLISPNALIGSEKGFQSMITPEFNQSMNRLLQDIKTRKFYQELDDTNVDELRKKIKARWHHSPLMETFRKINQDQIV